MTRQPTPGVYENYREPGEFGEGVTVRQPETYWTLEEYKVWKGIDPDKPVWASRGYLSKRWEDIKELCDYLERNNPELILRVAKDNWPEAQR